MVFVKLNAKSLIVFGHKEKVKVAVYAMENTRNAYLVQEKRRMDEEQRRLDDKKRQEEEEKKRIEADERAKIENSRDVQMKVVLPEAPNPLLRAEFESNNNSIIKKLLQQYGVKKIEFTDTDATLLVPKG